MFTDRSTDGTSTRDVQLRDKKALRKVIHERNPDVTSYMYKVHLDSRYRFEDLKNFSSKCRRLLAK